jgi:hypothetical protein
LTFAKILYLEMIPIQLVHIQHKGIQDLTFDTVIHNKIVQQFSIQSTETIYTDHVGHLEIQGCITALVIHIGVTNVDVLNATATGSRSDLTTKSRQDQMVAGTFDFVGDTTLLHIGDFWKLQFRDALS